MPDHFSPDRATALHASESIPLVDQKILREISWGAAGTTEVSQSGTSLLNRAAKHITNCLSKDRVARQRNPTCRAIWMNSRHEQGFGGINVSDTDDDPAIHDETLHRQSAVVRQSVQVLPIKIAPQGFGTQRSEQRVALCRALTPVQ